MGILGCQIPVCVRVCACDSKNWRKLRGTSPECEILRNTTIHKYGYSALCLSSTVLPVPNVQYLLLHIGMNMRIMCFI